MKIVKNIMKIRILALSFILSFNFFYKVLSNTQNNLVKPTEATKTEKNKSENIDYINDEFLDFGEEVNEYMKECVKDMKIEEIPLFKELADKASIVVNGPIWQRTSPVRSRDPLYLIPLSKTVTNGIGGFFVTPFYNSGKKIVTPIDSHIQFDLNETLVNSLISIALQQLNTTIDNVFTIRDFINYLNKFDIEERKSGFAFQFAIPWDWGFFQLDSNVLIVERNFITTPAVEKRLREMFTKFVSGGIESLFDEKEEFARILFGIGDTRLRFGFKPLDFPGFRFNGGVSLIIPTASSVTLNGHFKKAKNPNLNRLVDPFMKAAQDILLTGSLGNDGHYGAGIYLNLKVPIFRNKLLFHGFFSYDRYSSSRISISHLFTSKENRLFMQRQTVTREDVERDASSNLIAQAFYDQYLIPSPYQVTLNPGGVLELTLVLDGRVGNFGFRGGYDLFIKQHEVLEKLHSSTNIGALRINDGLSISFEQHKLMAEFSYDYRGAEVPLQFALGADCSIASKGIENDWTIYGRIGSTF